jgi:hypothetical protein
MDFVLADPEKDNQDGDNQSPTIAETYLHCLFKLSRSVKCRLQEPTKERLS